MKTLTMSPLVIVVGLSLSLLGSIASAQTSVLKDNISGYNHASTNTLNNQVAGVGGRQIIFSPFTLPHPTRLTRAEFLSNLLVPGANTFSYSIREITPPYTEIDSGTATRTNQSNYVSVTNAGSDSHLDDFSFSSQILPAGDYFFSVHAADGNPYQLHAHASIDTEPLIAENGGTPFLAGANFHLYLRLYGVEQTPTSAEAIPVLPPHLLVLLICVITLTGWRQLR